MPPRMFNDDDTPQANHIDTRITRLEAEFKALAISLLRIEGKLDNKFVTHEAFWPVKTIVYAGAGTVMMGVLGLIINLALHLSE